MAERPEYLLRIRVLPSDVPDASRLRSFLKRLGRAYGIQCVSIGPVLPERRSPANADTRPRRWRKGERTAEPLYELRRPVQGLLFPA